MLKTLRTSARPWGRRTRCVGLVKPMCVLFLCFMLYVGFFTGRDSSLVPFRSRPVRAVVRLKTRERRRRDEGAKRRDVARERARSPRFEGAREGEATGEGNARDVRDVRARIDQSIVDRIRWWMRSTPESDVGAMTDGR